MKSKILSSSFYKAHGAGANLTYYHNITLEGIDKTLNIGAKTQNPAFLAVGQELEWIYKDEAKGSIKKFVPQPGSSAVPPAGTFTPKDALEIKLSTAMIAAYVLLANDKITPDKFNETVQKVVKRFEEFKTTLA